MSDWTPELEARARELLDIEPRIRDLTTGEREELAELLAAARVEIERRGEALERTIVIANNRCICGNRDQHWCHSRGDTIYRMLRDEYGINVKRRP